MNILHTADPGDLGLLRQDAELAPWLSDQPAEGLVRLSPDHKPDEFVAQLQKRAWIPLVTRRREAIPPRSVTLDPEGRLCFKVKSPDFYLRGYLARFSDPDGADQYRITPGSIRRAVTSGMTAPQILDDLETVAVDPVPQNIRAQVLAWAGHYGQAVLEEVTLLTLKDAQTLAELMKDPELSVLMHTIHPPEVRQMVRVKAKDVEKLRKLLQARGVEMKKKEG